MSTLKQVSKSKFYIYRNLRTGGFSVKYRGLVIDRDTFFIGECATFKVNERGRQRVIRDKRKNVHAYIVCDKYTFASRSDAKLVDNLCVITYNPYIAGHFICNGQKIESAKKVLFFAGKCYLLEK